MPVCERCHEHITDPGDDVRAVEMIRDQAYGGEPGEPLAGRTVHFHRSHLPPDTGRYRPVEAPSAD